MVYASGTRLRAIPRHGGAIRELADLGAPIDRVEVEAAFARVWTQGDLGPQVSRVPLAGGSAEPIQTGGRTLSSAPAGGWQMITGPGEPGASLYAPDASLDGPPTRTLPPHSAVSWQHDGSALVYWDRRQMIHHMLADGTERVLFTADDVDDRELAPTATPSTSRSPCSTPAASPSPTSPRASPTRAAPTRAAC